jgi:PEGA domain
VTVIRVSKFWAGSRTATAVAAPLSVDELDVFGSETPGVETAPVEPLVEPPVETAIAPPPVGPPDPTPRVHRPSSKTTVWLTAILVALVSAGAAAASVWEYQRRVTARASASLTVQTSAPGAEVYIAGNLAGRTPLTTSLQAGSYDLRVVANGASRDLKLTLAAGASVFHAIELPPAAALAPETTGALHVQTEKKQLVSVDGIERGPSPLTIDGLTPGEHQVVVRGEAGTFRRVVEIKPRETLSLVISATEPAVIAPGWLSVTSPVTMQLREAGRLIGTTETDRLMLPAGEHDIEISNEALAYRVTRKLTIAPGKTTTSAVELPSALLSVNALPWAEIWIDGERVGETPLANLSRRIGQHQVVFRHPQFGERTETVLLTLRQPTRLGIDMRRQQP